MMDGRWESFVMFAPGAVNDSTLTMTDIEKTLPSRNQLGPIHHLLCRWMLQPIHHHCRCGDVAQGDKAMNIDEHISRIG